MAEENFDEFITKVAGFHKAIEEEFEIASSDDSADVRKLVDKKIAMALPGFVDTLINIAQFGETDNAKLNAIKFAFNYYFKDSGSVDDPFTKMLGDLMKDANKATTEGKSGS